MLTLPSLNNCESPLPTYVPAAYPKEYESAIQILSIFVFSASLTTTNQIKTSINPITVARFLLFFTTYIVTSVPRETSTNLPKRFLKII